MVWQTFSWLLFFCCCAQVASSTTRAERTARRHAALQLAARMMMGLSIGTADADEHAQYELCFVTSGRQLDSCT
jgi:hypothetical protein